MCQKESGASERIRCVGKNQVRRTDESCAVRAIAIAVCIPRDSPSHFPVRSLAARLTMAVILCKKYSTFHARLFMCAHTYLCPRAHESWRTSCAHAENKSYTRPLKFHVHFSAYMRTPVLVFSQQYGLAKKKIDVLVLFVTPI